MLVLPGNCSQGKTRSEHHVTQIHRNAFTRPLSVGRSGSRPFCRTRRNWQSVHGRATDDRPPRLATFGKPPVNIFGSGAFKSPSKVQFDFWISNADTKCPAKNVTVSLGLYHRRQGDKGARLHDNQLDRCAECLPEHPARVRQLHAKWRKHLLQERIRLAALTIGRPEL